MEKQRRPRSNKRESIQERFWRHVVRGKSNECWPWTWTQQPNGRAILNHGGKRYYAAKVAWSLLHGVEFPQNKLGCHTCDNPNCVNGNHVYPGTHGQNHRDAVSRGRWGYRGLPGTRNPRVKITEDDRERILRRFRSGERQADIGKDYGIAQAAISKIVTGRTWKHLTH